MTRRASARVEGVVQGVGFRPYVYRLAREEGLAGYVLNDERGVLLDVEGAAEAVARFVARLRGRGASAGGDRVGGVDVAAPDRRARVPRSCDEPARRRAGRPGRRRRRDLRRLPGRALRPRRPPLPLPVRQLHQLRPALHDRARRALRPAADDDGRLRHVRRAAGRSTTTRPTAASTRSPTPARTAGPRCGCGDARRRRRDARRPRRCCSTARSSRSRAWAATTSPAAPTTRSAVARLRARKHREDRPFALMARRRRGGRGAGRAGRGRGGAAGGRARARSCSRRAAPARPSRRRSRRAARELGVMLPYSPLHHLLAADAGRDAGDDERQRLRRADRLPRRRRARAPGGHRRPRSCSTTARSTRAPTTRSCARSAAGRCCCAARAATCPRRWRCRRRARRCWPAAPSSRARSASPRAPRAWPGHHIGDLRNEETLRSFAEGVAHFERLFAVTPEVVAHDLHPDYLSTTYALARDDVRARRRPAPPRPPRRRAWPSTASAGRRSGAIYDGTGYGTDGTVWGGELLAGDLAASSAPATCWPVRLPGGDRAVRQPWRMACAWLRRGRRAPAPAAAAAASSRARWHAVASWPARGWPRR